MHSSLMSAKWLRTMPDWTCTNPDCSYGGIYLNAGSNKPHCFCVDCKGGTNTPPGHGARSDRIRSAVEQRPILEARIKDLETELEALRSRPCVKVWEHPWMNREPRKPGVKWQVNHVREGHVFAFPDGSGVPGMVYAYCLGCGLPEHEIFTTQQDGKKWS